MKQGKMFFISFRSCFVFVLEIMSRFSLEKYLVNLLVNENLLNIIKQLEAKTLQFLLGVHDFTYDTFPCTISFTLNKLK